MKRKSYLAHNGRGSARAILASTLASAMLAAAAVPAVAVEVRESHYVMGTLLDITVDAPDRSTGQSWIRSAVAVAARLDGEMSSYRSDSALAKLNSSAGTGPQSVTADLYRVLAISLSASRASHGAFDVTVGALTSLARRARERGYPVTSAEHAAAVATVDWQSIDLAAPDRVVLRKTGAAVDLGAVGKGYAADAMAARLRSLGVKSALINFGTSTMLAVGPPPTQAPWRIWLRGGVASVDTDCCRKQPPSDSSSGESVVAATAEQTRGMAGAIGLRNGALSTSRSFHGDVDEEEAPRPHIIDPRDGSWIESERQATVLAADATTAEIWSTALLVEPQTLLAVVEATEGLEALLIVEGRVSRTSDFERLADWELRQP